MPLVSKDSSQIVTVPPMTIIKESLRPIEDSFEAPVKRVCIVCDSDDVPYRRNPMYIMCIACEPVFAGLAIEPAFTPYVKSHISKGTVPKGMIISHNHRGVRKPRSGTFYIKHEQSLFIMGENPEITLMKLGMQDQSTNIETEQCWFCDTPIQSYDEVCMCDEFDYAPYHPSCGNKITTDQTKCAICVCELGGVA